MRQSINEITIRAPVERVMEYAFDLPRWPTYLPHYRWVTILDRKGDRLTVEMACWRAGIPLKWRSHLWILPDERRMQFRHIAGPARGMDVEWELREEGEHVHVSIRHVLSLEVPVVKSALGQWIVGEFFVGAVAGRTLAWLKKTVEESLA